MNTQQMQAARESLIQWLSNPQRLGKRPARIECAGEMDLQDLHYYLFKFKKGLFGGPWMLGVCGGYAKEQLEHCGHVGSEMEPWNPENVQEMGKALVEKIKRFGITGAPSGAGESRSSSFISFVLLENKEWSMEAYLKDLMEEWEIQPKIASEEAQPEQKDMIVWEEEGMMAAISLMPGPVPNGEAEHHAGSNYLWPEAVAEVGRHQAHLLITVLARDGKPQEAGKLLVKLTDAAMKAESCIGVYTSGTVFEPSFYREAAAVMKNGEMPYLCWVYLGLGRSGEKTFSGYTYGLRSFGRDEIEVLDAETTPQALRSFLLNMVAYILAYDVVLNPGETIGLTEEQKLPIERSPGVFLDGDTIKLQFMD